MAVTEQYDFGLPIEGSANDGITSYSTVYAKNKPQLSGITIKNAPANLIVVGYKNTEFTGKTFYASNKFFLQNITEVNQEKLQVLETFGDPILLFFNNRTKVYSFTGTFLDANDGTNGVEYMWADAFKLFYDENLRGTRLVDNEQIAIMSVNNQMYIGYPTALNINTNANNPLIAGFSMTFIVVDHYILPTITTGAITSSVVGTYIANLKKLYTKDSIGNTASRDELLTEIDGRLKQAQKEVNTLTIKLLDLEGKTNRTAAEDTDLESIKIDVQTKINLVDSIRAEKALI